MIVFIFYNPKQEQLRVQFDGGKVYDYYLVKPEVGKQAEVALAGHDPTFFRSRIRGVYPHRRVA